MSTLKLKYPIPVLDSLNPPRDTTRTTVTVRASMAAPKALIVTRISSQTHLILMTVDTF